MRQVRPLKENELKELEYSYKSGDKHHFRIRCQGILLSNEGLSVAEIAFRLKKQKDTIYSWLNSYESQGINGLKNAKGQGVKARLDSITEEQLDSLKKAVKDEPQNLNKVGAFLSQLFGFKVTKLMLIRFLKKTELHMA